jgi:hypothetical protein
MLYLAIIEIGFLFSYVAFLVYEYAEKEVPLYVKFLTFISWVTSFSIVLLVPHDIYYVCINMIYCKTYQLLNDEDATGFDTLKRIWQLVYWLNFILTWLVLPLF